MTARHEPTRILVVDDEEAVRNALVRYLAGSGYEATGAGDGPEALAKLAGDRFAAMVCDIRMPGMSGLELVPRAIAHDPDLAILMLTAVGEPASAIECLRNGATDYLIKPVELEELSLALQYALRKRELEIERRDLEVWLAREVAEKTRQIEEQSRQVEALAVSVLMALVEAIEPPGPEGRTHSTRVANLAAHVAAELALSPEDIDQIHIAARLHDIGRVAMRDEGLRRVTGEQREELVGPANEPAVAARILQPLHRYQAVARIIGFQHERWDGMGRPAGLRGEAIPLGARIVAAANLYDELTEAPEGERSLESAEALENMRSLAGTLLDPGVLGALEKVIARRA